MMNNAQNEDNKDLIFGFSHDDPNKFYPETYYTNACFEGVFHALTEGLQQWPAPLLLLNGESGVGKTLMLQRIMADAGGNADFLPVPPAARDFDLLLSFACEKLQLTPAPKPAARQQALLHYSAQHGSTEQGRRCVLIVDDAHALDDVTLDRLLTLAQTAFDHGHGLQLLLSGRSGLKQRLAALSAAYPMIEAGVCTRLLALSDVEVPVFINCRMQTPNNPYDVVFPAAAIERITCHAQGIPGLINRLCHESLKAARHSGEQKVSADIVDDVAERIRAAIPVDNNPVDDRDPMQPALVPGVPAADIAVPVDAPVAVPPPVTIPAEQIPAAAMAAAPPSRYLVPMVLLLGVLAGAAGGVGSLWLYETAKMNGLPDGDAAVMNDQENDVTAGREVVTALQQMVTSLDQESAGRKTAAPAPESVSAPESAAKLARKPVADALPLTVRTTSPATSKPKQATTDEADNARTTDTLSKLAIDADFYVERGNAMLALGDVASARLFYQAGAKAGETSCLTAIGITYDPLALEQRGLTAIYADSGRAIAWYEKAARAGERQAMARLSQLRTWLSDAAGINATVSRRY